MVVDYGSINNAHSFYILSLSWVGHLRPLENIYSCTWYILICPHNLKASAFVYSSFIKLLSLSLFLKSSILYLLQDFFSRNLIGLLNHSSIFMSLVVLDGAQVIKLHLFLVLCLLIFKVALFFRVTNVLENRCYSIKICASCFLILLIKL